MAEPSIRLHAYDRHPLGAELLPARAPRRGTALLLHAMMVDRRSMDRPAGKGFASSLQDRGWDVLLADYRGRGLSGAPAGLGADWSYDDLVLHDLPAFVELARGLGGPVVVVGHSLGGHTTAAAMGCGLVTIDALVAISANVWLRRHEPSLPAALGKSALTAALLASTQAFGHVPSRLAGIGPVDEARSYARDLARFWWSDAWTSRDGRVDYLAAAHNLTEPVLAVYGTGDAWLARQPAASAWATALGAEVWLAGGGAHGLDHAPSHMGVITDPRSAPLWARIADWMDAAVR